MEVKKPFGSSSTDAQQKLEIGFFGYISVGACKLFTLFNDRHGIAPDRAVYGSDFFASDLVPKFHITCRVYTEQVRYSTSLLVSFDTVFMHIFHFDLSNASTSKYSYDIAKQRIKDCRTSKAKHLCMIGICSDNNVNDEALSLFQQLQSEERIENVLCCDADDERALQEFMTNLIYPVYNIPLEKKLPEPEPPVFRFP